MASKNLTRCERCGYQRQSIMFRQGGICQRCIHGDFNANLAEYCTPLDMRMAGAALRIPLTRAAVDGMMRALQVPLPVDTVRAKD